MPGKRTPENADYMSPCAYYRERVQAADSGPTDAGVAILDTTVSPHAGLGLGQSDHPLYGRNAQLNFSIILSTGMAGTFDLWKKAVIEQDYLEDNTPVANPDALPVASD